MLSHSPNYVIKHFKQPRQWSGNVLKSEVLERNTRVFCNPGVKKGWARTLRTVTAQVIQYVLEPGKF